MSDDGTIARRGLVRGILPALADGAAEVIEERFERAVGRHPRPPGAVRETEFLLLCTRCDACVSACPHQAIFRFTDDAGPILGGTPVMRPDRRACHLCEDFPCSSACPEGALEVPSVDEVWFGIARIREDRCIAFQGPECGACAGVCPGSVRAIEMVSWRPQLSAGECVGCGKCIEACPTDPPAIELADR